LSFLC